MRRLGWLALAIVVLAFTYLAFSVLAPWQLGKNTETHRENSQIAHSLTTEPVPVTALLPQQDSSAPDARWRRVTASGHYLADKQVLVRLRVIEGQPAFEVLLPFVVDGGPTVLVNRGYVRPEHGSQVPLIPSPPTGEVTISARLRNSEGPVPGKEPMTDAGFTQVYSIDAGQVAALTGVPLAGSYLQLVSDQPGGLGVLGLPQLDAGPFLSYGIQWIAFGIIAPIGLGYFAYAELRARRAAKEQALTPPQTVEEKMADRYGRHR